MGLLDKLRGSREPKPDVAPLSRDAVRAALLAVGGPDAPWMITDGAPEMDLVAEWDLGGGGTRQSPERTFRTLMRLDEAAHQVRAIDELVAKGGGRSYQRGNISIGGFSKTYRRGPEGYEPAEEHQASTATLKDALRAAATDSGWAWEGRIARKP